MHDIYRGAILMFPKKGVAIVIVSILVFGACCFYAIISYESPGQDGDDPLESKAWEAMGVIRATPVLIDTDVSVQGVFDPEKVDTIDGSALASAFEEEGVDMEGYEFQLEVEDVGGYGNKITRTMLGGNAIQSANPPAAVGKGELAKVESTAALYFSPNEVHAAKLTLRVWR